MEFEGKVEESGGYLHHHHITVSVRSEGLFRTALPVETRSTVNLYANGNFLLRRSLIVKEKVFRFEEPDPTTTGTTRNVNVRIQSVG